MYKPTFQNYRIRSCFLVNHTIIALRSLHYHKRIKFANIWENCRVHRKFLMHYWRWLSGIHISSSNMVQIPTRLLSTFICNNKDKEVVHSKDWRLQKHRAELLCLADDVFAIISYVIGILNGEALHFIAHSNWFWLTQSGILLRIKQIWVQRRNAQTKCEAILLLHLSIATRRNEVGEVWNNFFCSCPKFRNWCIGWYVINWIIIN